MCEILKDAAVILYPSLDSCTEPKSDISILELIADHVMRVFQYAMVAIFAAFFHTAAVYAQSEIAVDVEMDEYSLGDNIVFVLKVPDLSYESAILTFSHDLQNVTSLEIPVYNTTSTYTSPDPINSFYQPGLWTLQIQYGELSADDVFTILDSDDVLLPSWFRNISILWASTIIQDTDYGKYLYLLYDAKILDSPIPTDIQSAVIPDWFKNLATKFWTDGHIDDSTYVNIIDYLLPEIIVLK